MITFPITNQDGSLTVASNNLIVGVNTVTGNGPYNVVIGVSNILTTSGGLGRIFILGDSNEIRTGTDGVDYGDRGYGIVIGWQHYGCMENAAAVGFHHALDGRGTFNITSATTMQTGTTTAGAGGQAWAIFGAGGHVYWHGVIVLASHHNKDGQQSWGDVSTSSVHSGVCPAISGSVPGTVTGQLKLSSTYNARLVLKPNTSYVFEFHSQAAFITVAERSATWLHRVVVHQGAAGTTPLLREVTQIGRGRGSSNGEVPYGWGMAFTVTTQELVVNVTLANPNGSAAAWTALASFRCTETSAYYNAGGGPTLAGVMLSRDDMGSPDHLMLRDEFIGKNVTTNTIGELDWSVTGVTATANGSVLNHPGLLKLAVTNTTGLLSLQSLSTPITAWAGTTMEWLFRVTDTSPTLRVAVGLAADLNTYVSGGCRYLVYDAALSANWRILHYDGGAAYTDTGVPYVLNDWVHVKLFINGTTTVATIRTTTYPTPVTVSSGAGGYGAGTSHCPVFWLGSTTAADAVSVDLDFFSIIGAMTRI